VSVSLQLSDDGKRPSFRNVVFSINLESGTMDKVQNPSNSERIEDILGCVSGSFHNRVSLLTVTFEMRCKLLRNYEAIAGKLTRAHKVPSIPRIKLGGK
jgi:hypothetical protein